MEQQGREILFRGKRLDNGEWIEGFLVKCTGRINYGEFYMFTTVESFTFENRFCCIGPAFKVDPATVGQYTGRTDKNGVKIFEGDIVFISIPLSGCKPIEGVSDVYFDNGCFCVNWGRNYRPHHRTWIDSFSPDTGFEVIGNIYDNPELLGDGRNEN